MSTPVTTPAAEQSRIVFCAWCKKIMIDVADVREVSSITLFPKDNLALVNGFRVLIADGMCQGCRATKFGDVPKKVVTHDLAQK
jgi:hypothetical protein